MGNQSYLKSFAWRDAIKIGLTVLIAFIVDDYFSFSKNGFITLAAFFVSQASRGAPLRQGLISLLMMLMALCFSFLLLKFISPQFVLNAALAIIFILIVMYVFTKRPTLKIGRLCLIFFSVLFVVLMHAKFSWVALQNSIIDMIIGSVIALLCRQVLFTDHSIDDFQDNMLLVSKAFIAYSNAFIDYFSHPEMNTTALILARKQLQIIWQAPNHYPEWIYEVGFNPGLRAGLRFFLVTIEQLAEVFFSLDYLISQPIEAELLSSLAQPIIFSLQQDRELIQMMIAFFSHQAWQQTTADLVTDIAELENKLQLIVPASLELLDVSVDYLRLTLLVRHIKDLRQLLLKLILALPVTEFKASVPSGV
ncbi:MAG: hypothetical protein JO149_08480 [Gammaproteobacteria bacterium]|nr:hypothetical protein [Gammaproteobacteria bacterium]